MDNLDGTIGQFSIKDDIYPPGFMTDNGDNTATFNPSILDWVTTGQDYTVGLFIRYDYLNKDGVPLYEHTEMVIEYFETAKIGTNLSEQKYCTNEGTFSLEGSRPTNDVFSGSGVVDLGGFEYEFDLSKADTGENWITYTYISPYKCVQKDSAMIMVYEAPDPEFEFIEHCVMAEGGLISMSNTSDTSGLIGSLSWEWVYGDIPSGEFNRDVFFTMQNGSHHYPGPGRRTVSLTGTDTISDKKRCQEVESITIDLGNTPDVDISWDTECFTDSPVQFKGTSETEDGDENFLWRITDMAGTEVVSDEGPALDMLSHRFAARDKYSVEFTAVTDKGCIAAITDTIYLRPYIRNITDDAPYTEDFEGDAAGWYSFMLKDSPKKSWKLDDVETEKFPYDLPENGSRAWYTDLVNKDTVEQSWVSSPCFDFSSARRPMISLDRKVSSDRDRDGTALQYTYDDGETWHNVGAVDDGSVNWYNTFRIQYGPGGQGEGWTGAFEFDSLENWKQSRHNLDQLTGKSRVQFRIAYASSGPSVYQYKGFAFDNIWIGERSRVVLIEHFTNSGMIESNEANQRINKLVKNNFLDVIDIQYHVEAEGYTDKMNEDNPAPASARSLFYGTRQVPYALIDGGLGGLMAYDFSENDLDTLDLFTRALADPSFNIEFEASSQDGKVDINIDLEALDTLPYGEYIVYTVIVEKTIDDPAYTGAGSVSVFENVVRAMVPNAAGISLIRDWNPGDSEQIPLSWDISDNILNEDLAYVVVFVQGAENQKVYQAASNDPDLNSDPVISSVNDHLESGSLSMMVYPNPATGTAYLSFSEALAETVEVQLFTHTGSLARNGLLLAGTEVYEMDVSGLARGVYFIRAIQDGKVIGTRKLMIMR